MARSSNPADRMWADACELLAQAERMHQQFFRLASPAMVPTAWEPPADVLEDERELVVVVAMPGVAADRIEVALERDQLVVRGVRPVPFAHARHAVRQLEIPYGVFERRIALPGARLESGTPQLVNGCVVLRLTKVG